MQNWIEEAIRLYKENVPYCKIANIVGVNRKTVSVNLRKLGFKSNEKYARKINPEKFRKYDYSIVESVFENIDTEEKAYWLGFLYADGYVDDVRHSVSLALKEEDKEHVEKFRDFCGLYGKKLHKKIRNIKGKKYVSYELCFQSKKATDDLIKCGCVNKKTFILNFPSTEILPEKLSIHFIRGYMDGDGSITHGGKNASSITLETIGTDDFLKTYYKKLGFEGKNTYRFNHSTVRRAILSGPYAIYALDSLYKNANIFLPRKYEKYLELRRLALQSPRTARLLAGKIGEGLTANTEVIAV